MRTYCVLGRVVVLCLLASCGQSKFKTHDEFEVPPPPQFQQPLENIPPKLTLTGRWEAVPAFQQRDLGASRMVSLTGRVLASLAPEVTGLAGALEFGRRESAQWVSPVLPGCTLTQISIVKHASDPLRLDLSFWGWDKAGAPACETALQQAQTVPIRLLLKGVGVRASNPVPEVVLELGL